MPGHNCRGKFLVYMGMDDEFDDDLREEEDDIPDKQVVASDMSHIFAMNGRQKEEDIELIDRCDWCSGGLHLGGHGKLTRLFTSAGGVKDGTSSAEDSPLSSLCW